MPPIRKYAQETYGPSWLRFCLPPPLVAERVICQLNCSPWDVMSPNELQELSNFQESEPEMEKNLERKDELIGDDETMAITENITRTLAEPDLSPKDDDKERMKIRKRRTKRIVVVDDNIEKKKKIITVNKVIGEMKKISKKRRTTKRNGGSENTVNKVVAADQNTVNKGDDSEMIKKMIKKRNGSSENTFNKDGDNRGKRMIKKRRTSTKRNGNSESAANKVGDNRGVKSDSNGGWCNRQSPNNLDQSQNIDSEKNKKIETESYSAKPQEIRISKKEKKIEPVDFIVRRVYKNDFYYYEEDEDDDEEKKKKKKVARKYRKKGVM